MAEVAFDSLGFAFIRFFIRPCGNPLILDLPYKVDTGANSTTINREALHGLGYDDYWVQSGKQLIGLERPTVATGEPVDSCYLITLPEIQLGGCVGYNWPFFVSLNDKIQFRLLLGTDSMQFFNWNFDYETGICRFDLIPGKRKLLFNRQEQSIYAIDESETKCLIEAGQSACWCIERGLKSGKRIICRFGAIIGRSGRIC